MLYPAHPPEGGCAREHSEGRAESRPPHHSPPTERGLRVLAQHSRAKPASAMSRGVLAPSPLSPAFTSEFIFVIEYVVPFEFALGVFAVPSGSKLPPTPTSPPNPLSALRRGGGNPRLFLIGTIANFCHYRVEHSKVTLMDHDRMKLSRVIFFAVNRALKHDYLWRIICKTLGR